MAVKYVSPDIAAFLQSRQSRLNSIQTTTTPLGEVVDWISRDAQQPAAALATPPPPSVVVNPENQVANLVQFALEAAPGLRGPQGSVPVLRPNAANVNPSRGLSDFLSKYHRRSTRYARLANGFHIALPSSSPTEYHRYVSTGQVINCFGGEGNITVWHPYTESPGDFSLMQIGLTYGQDDLMQSVEAGWQVFPEEYGDNEPRLFTYYTTNGYSAAGDNIGGYNRTVSGWVQYDSTICPGARISAGGVPGGNQIHMPIKYRLYQGNWWLSVAGRWIGYYPASLFARNSTVAATLGEQADWIAFWGEVYDAEDAAGKGKTRTTMGSGLWAEDGYGWAALQNCLKVQTDPAGTLADYDGASTFVSDAQVYSLVMNMKSGTPAGSYFHMGGPGASC